MSETPSSELPPFTTIEMARNPAKLEALLAHTDEETLEAWGIQLLNTGYELLDKLSHLNWHLGEEWDATYFSAFPTLVEHDSAWEHIRATIRKQNNGNTQTLLLTMLAPHEQRLRSMYASFPDGRYQPSEAHVAKEEHPQ